MEYKGEVGRKTQRVKGERRGGLEVGKMVKVGLRGCNGSGEDSN